MGDMKEFLAVFVLLVLVYYVCGTVVQKVVSKKYDIISKSNFNGHNGGIVTHELRFNNDLNRLVVDRDTGIVSVFPLNFLIL